MRVGSTFDFSLSGRTIQDSFDVSKYKALAGGSVVGHKLSKLVEDHWVEWLKICSNAPWLKNWPRSQFYKQQTVDGTPPSGEPLPHEWLKEAGPKPQPSIALVLYVEAVWGYGMSNWPASAYERGAGHYGQRNAESVATSLKKYSDAMSMVLSLQNVKAPNMQRTYFWDDAIYRGCGFLVPCEFGDLDRWLEPYWQQALHPPRA